MEARFNIILREYLNEEKTAWSKRYGTVEISASPKVVNEVIDKLKEIEGVEVE